ncbi:MAG TPA: DUF2007 domain-containing protein [Bacteroidota bacterium]|jgi:hypothetical protein|nr:DUF2007 domain-containing protein [Bacteroidota bacterium]
MNPSDYHCGDCGGNISESDLLCPTCGATLEWPDAKQADDSKIPIEHTHFVRAFRSGRLWEIDMARDELKNADIPFFVREENLSGLSLAFPAIPAPGIGVTWSILVPESFVDKAKEALTSLPIEVDKQPGFWDFTTDSKVQRGLKIFIWTMLIFYGYMIFGRMIYGLFAGLLRGIFRH